MIYSNENHDLQYIGRGNIMKLSKLFHKCAYEIKYEQAGDSVNYAFVEEGRSLLIFFQGSNSITDWVRNFLFGKRPYKDMKVEYKVHRGFLAAWKEVEDIIIKKVTDRQTYGEWKYTYDKIIIVGYSHGGALAGLCHECVWFHRPDLRETGLIGYGFEAPRFYAGWKVKDELKERWEKFFVIRTNNDIVTHCPPVIFKYCHVGSIMKVKGDISLVQNKLPKCVKSHYPQVVYDALLKEEAKGE
jgi:hypothetical protein